MAPETEERLRAVFRAVFELRDDGDAEQQCRQGEGSWDSLGHVSLMLALESEFGVSIDAADSLSLTSYDVVRSYLQERGL